MTAKREAETMAAFNDEEKRILANVLPGIAAALRPPLNNLHMAAVRLTARQSDSTESAILRQSYYRMLRLVGNLTMGPELTSDKPFETKNEELVVLMDEMCRQAGSIAREQGVMVCFECRERYVVAAVDRGHWERLVWNLLSNALKATPEGGTITVTLEVKGGQVLLRVRDTGRGIPAERQERLFRQWTEALPAVSSTYGMGLGLPICRRIAQGHGGRLLLESREGQGTLVTVAIPHVRKDGGQVREDPYDYAGGFSHVMMELSDALPYQSFEIRHLDEE